MTVHPLLRRTFMALAVLAVAGDAAAQTVTGRLLDGTSRQPVLLGVVVLMDTAMVLLDRTYTDEQGRFVLEAPRPGHYYVAAARAGYTPDMDGVLELPSGSSIELAFYLVPNAIVLDSILVAARREPIEPYLSTHGFYERLDLGFGHTITPGMLERRPPTDFADLLRGVPGVYVSEDPRGTAVRMRGPTGQCVPRIYVDGAPNSTIAGDAVVDDFVDVIDLIGVEVYTRVSSAPLQYAGLTNCGVILFWTKRGR